MLMISVDVRAAIADDAALKPVTIPLKAIWALDMPGTRPMRRGLPVAEAPESPIVSEIIKEGLRFVPASKDNPPGPGFAVVGDDFEALKKAHGILVEGLRPRRIFPDDREIWIVFHSRKCGSYVHIVKAERSGQEVKVFYRFVQHPEDIVTAHFALIPLGITEAGTTHVDFIRLPDTDVDGHTVPPLGDDAEQLIVCKPFELTVQSSSP